MKNKKLIATVASLCLVLVAVVAAVIGVLAATRQNVQNKIKVNYTAAPNVYATVKLNGRSEVGDWGETDESIKFGAAEGTSTKTLTFQYDGLTLSQRVSDGAVAHYALYRFSFKNEHNTASSDYPLNVSLAYTQVAAKEVNVRLFWVKGNTNDDWTPDADALSYSDAGVLTTTSQTASWDSDLTNGGFDFYGNYATPTSTGAIAKGATAYVYLVVAIVDLNSDASLSVGGEGESSIQFNLSGYKAPAQQSGN